MCWLEGTCRWLPGTPPTEVELDFRSLLNELANDTRTMVDVKWTFIRDAFRLEENASIVQSFQRAYQTISDKRLPSGPKPFVDDGNCFYAKNIPAITHGPRAGGQHTVNEWVDIDDMVRVAHLYALTAVLYCGQEDPTLNSGK
jgi:acetylornithine deacetylase/succinyl-diaminopimelate desuccinylase-like protein